MTRAGTPGAASLAELDTLATEFEVKVALETAPPATESRRPSRAGAPGWARPSTWERGCSAARRRPMPSRSRTACCSARVSDCSALGAAGKPVALGEGAGGLADFFLASYTAGIKPLPIVVESLGTTEADLARNLAASNA